MVALQLSGVCVRSFFLLIVGAHVLHSRVLEYNVVKIGNTIEMTIAEDHTYIFSVNATDAYQQYSSFVFQVHTAESNVTLTNISSGCTVSRDCSTVGSHVGMVQLLAYPVTHTLFNFSVGYVGHPGNGSNASQEMMMAVVGVPLYNPIPGGCSLTSALEIDAMLSLTSADSASNTTITFQNSDIGYNPQGSGQPACTDRSANINELKYRVYQKCYKGPSTAKLFRAIKSLMSPASIKGNILFSFGSYSAVTAKKLVYMMRRSQTVVINVFASDVGAGNTSAYIPSVFTWCADGSSHCSYSISTPIIVCAPVMGLIGLFLCFLAHRFFHAEVVLFSSLISCYVVYFVLSASVDWNDIELLSGSMVLGLMLTLLLFIMWFFSNWCCVFLGLFSLSMSFLVTASILSTPIGGVELLRLWYVYMLAIFCGMLIFIVPFVAFPTALNIVSSSMVGSYAVIYSFGLFVDSYLTEIVLGVVRNAAIPGYLVASGRCELDLLDIVLSCIWVLLFVVSISTQSIFERVRRKSFRKNQEMKMESWNSSCARPKVEQYVAFPSISLYAQLMRAMKNWSRRQEGELYSPTSYSSHAGERRPLLSSDFIATQPTSAMQRSYGVYDQRHS